MRIRLTFVPTGLAGAALCATTLGLAAPAFADPTNLVQNGSFETTSATTPYGGTTVGTNVNNTNLPGWQINGCANSNSTCGFQFIGNSNYSTAGFYDAEDHHESTFYSTPGVSPDGGNAFMSDGNYQVNALYQSVSGLKIGDTYTLKFLQASLQQAGYTGAAQDNWNFGLYDPNSQVFNSRVAATMNNPSQGSTSWAQQTATFVATSTSELLHFFASANQGAQPPFLLLDGVSLADNAPNVTVPEPATIALVGAGFASMIAARRRRRA